MPRLVIRKPDVVTDSYLELDGVRLDSVSNIVVTEEEGGAMSICLQANKSDIAVVWDEEEGRPNEDYMDY